MLDGQNKKFQYIVELNAGAAIYLSGITNNLKEGFKLAKHVIESKKSKNFLKEITS